MERDVVQVMGIRLEVLSNPHGSDVTQLKTVILNGKKELSNPHGSDVTYLR